MRECLDDFTIGLAFSHSLERSLEVHKRHNTEGVVLIGNKMRYDPVLPIESG